MHTVTISEDQYSIPSRWNELNKEQLLNICRLSNLGLPPGEFKVLTLLNFLKLQPDQRPEATLAGRQYYYLRNPQGRVYMITAPDIHYLTASTKWLLQKCDDENENTYVLKSRLSKNLIPSILIGGVTYYGPDDALTNCSYHEYMVAETALDNFRCSEDPKFVDRVIATLYRPSNPAIDTSSPDYSGDIRIKLNDYHIDDRIKLFSRLTPETKTAIMFFYNGCRDYLTFKYPHVYEPPDDLTYNVKSKKKTSSCFENHMRIITAISNNDVTKHSAIRESNLHEVLLAFEQMLIQQEKLISNFKK